MVVVSLVELYGQRRTKKDKYFQQRGTKSRLLSRLLPAFAFSLSFETRVHLLFDIMDQYSTRLRLFVYGSLIWNPKFNYLTKRAAYTPGYARRLCLGNCGSIGDRDQVIFCRSKLCFHFLACKGSGSSKEQEFYSNWSRVLYRR